MDSAPYRRRILAELAEVDEALAEAQTAAGTVDLDQSSFGRLSRMDAMQQQAMAQGMRERLMMRKRKLEAALDRMEAGSFGLCCQCQAAIEPERLEGDPAAVFCFACMVERDTDWGHHEAR